MYKVIIAILMSSLLVQSIAQNNKVDRPTFMVESNVMLTKKVSNMKAVTEKEWQQMILAGKKKLLKEKKKESYSYPIQNDPVIQNRMPAGRGANSPLLTFEGAESAFYPSDATGSVDSNYYVQAVNATFSVYSKTGNLEAGPIALNSLFTGLPGGTYNNGDPIVMYDEQANRWLITEMSSGGDNDYLMMAVSQTNNPLGAWYSYSFDVDDWPDYPKYSIWHDGYYIGIDKLGNNNQDQEDVFAVERSKMLQGQPAKMVGFINTNRPNTSYSIAAPVDNEGAFASSTSPGLFIAINYSQWTGPKDQLWLYEMDVDWNNIFNSTFSRTQTIDVASFTPGPDPVQPAGYSLDGLSGFIMNKPVFRNFTNHQELVCCHTVTGSSGFNAGIRWYELRKTGSQWQIRQQGTYSPDSESRWIGSITMNSNHRIALGYSITGSSTYAGIRYAAQSPTAYAAANGTLDIAEETIPTNSHLQSASYRWGDYSNISVDPSNDSVFWYTNQYIGPYTGRKTKVAKFKFGPYSITSDFFADTTVEQVNSIVKLYDISYGSPTTWSWVITPSTFSYAGGTSSSSQYPRVQFSNPGDYSIALTVGNGTTSNTLTKTNYITIDSICSVTSFPWTEDFENSGNTPTCWTQEYLNNYNEDWQYVNGDNGLTSLTSHSGSYNAYFYESDAYTRIISPKLVLGSLTTPQMDFWYVQDGYEFKVLYKATESASWTVLKTYSNNKSIWTHDTIVLPNNGNSSYIAFQSSTFGSSYGICIDDVTIQESGISCAPPLGPVSEPSGTTAVVSWESQNNSPVWELEYGLNGFVLGSGTTISPLSDTTYTITGLTASTAYDWYARKKCSTSDSSNWTGPNSFTTTTIPFSLPLSEDFENGFVKFVNATTVSVNFLINTNLHHGGAKCAANFPTNNNTNYLEMTSYVDLSGTTYPMLTFWHIANIEGGGDFCKVQISIDNGTSWTTLPTTHYEGDANNYSAYQQFDENSYSTWAGNPADNTWWKKETYALNQYKNKHVKVRFYLYTNNSGSKEGWYIDDILIEDPVCVGIYPDSLFTSNIAGTSATLSWTERGSATNWDIEYGSTGFSQGTGTTISGASSNPYTLTSLTTNSSYDWYVRSSCGSGNYSDWEGPATFTTTCSPTTLPYFEDFEGVTVPALPSCFVSENANNDAQTWRSSPWTYFSGDKSVTVANTTSTPSDDWMFLPGITLQAGVSYEIGFMYGTSGGNQGLEISWGDYPEAVSMTNGTLWTKSNITSWSFEFGKADFTPSTTGTYYFGFHATSLLGSSGSLNIDDIYINANSASATWTGTNSNAWWAAANWNNDTIPTGTTDVFISANATHYPTLTKLSVAKNFTLKSDAQGNGSLLGNGFLKVSGQTNVERFLTAGKWHLISSPVENATVNSLYFNGNPDVWLKHYNESSDTWTYISDLTTPMPFGAGFATWVEAGNDTVATFTGNFLNQGLWLDPWSTPPINFTDVSHGYNLVGNPYPSALDWDIPGWDTTDIEGSVWVWNNVSNNYVYRNSLGQGSLTNGIIPIGQGFFIRAKSNNCFFGIMQDARVHSNQTYYKATSEFDIPTVVIKAVNDSMEDEVWVSFADESTEEYDNGMDIHKMFSNNVDPPQIYFTKNDDELSIIAVPMLYNSTRVINLNYEVGRDGEQKLMLDQTYMMENTDILLEDLRLNITNDFKQIPVYIFNGTAGDDVARFRIYFVNLTLSAESSNESSNVNIFSNMGAIYVVNKNNQNSQLTNIQVFDMLGRKVKEANTKNTVYRISELLTNNYYIVKLLINNTVVVKKVYLQ